MGWTYQFKPSAEKQLGKLPRDVQVQVVRALDRLCASLSGDPVAESLDVKKLAGRPDEWRVRAGDYRVIFTRENNALVVLVLHVGHRKDVYRG